MSNPFSGENTSSTYFEKAKLYASHELFQRDKSQPDNPWARKLPIPELPAYDSDDSAVTKESFHSLLSSPTALFNNRVLLSIYERDFVLLPKGEFEGKIKDFNTYYGDELSFLGDQARLGLEHTIFPSIHNSINVSGEWNLDRFRDYYESFAASYEAEGHGEITRRVVSSPNPKATLQFYLIQAACDFLVESSAMARNTIGNYGVVQSEFFKVLIDESGYGVHSSRHSTLFEKVMQSVGLDATPHTYWDYYLTSTLLTANYYNYCGKNHRKLFRYLGALLHVETCFSVTCGQMADMVRRIEGADAELRYFTEHVHIDKYHSKMALEKIIEPAVNNFGNWALEEIIIGFEESRQISDLHGKGMMWQLDLIERIQSHSLFLGSSKDTEPSATMSLHPNKIFELPLRATETSIHVLSGEMKISAAPNCTMILKPMEIFTVPAGALCKLSAESRCDYKLQ